MKEDSITGNSQRVKEDKDNIKEFKSKVYKYAAVIYRNDPVIFIRNVYESSNDLMIIYMFKNLEKRKNFLKLHKDCFTENKIFLARIDRKKNLTYEK